MTALDDPPLAPVLDALITHPEHDHSLESLAGLASMSRSSFAQHFTRCFGRPPMTLLREVRLRRSAELLQRSGLPIATVGRRVGFSSRSHFSRQFSEYFGESPAQFRREPQSKAPIS